MTLKEDHDLVTRGPYGIVRDPIYTGILLAFAGHAIARGEWRCIVGVLIATWAFGGSHHPFSVTGQLLN